MSRLVQPIVSRSDAVGRAIIALCAIAAAYAALSTLTPVAPDLVWLSTWQMLGFALFAGMFALLAIRPRLSAGVWELCFLNKAGLFIASLFVSWAPGATEAGLFDGVLAALIALAYGLTKGWQAWENRPRA